jgi:flagellar hook-basal body complex protein FliE
MHQVSGLERALPTAEVRPASAAPRAEGVAGAPGTDFGGVLEDALKSASALERSADEASRRFASGDPEMGIHEVMIATEKAQVAVRYAVTLKNRVVEAYRELMNTTV